MRFRFVLLALAAAAGGIFPSDRDFFPPPSAEASGGYVLVTLADTTSVAPDGRTFAGFGYYVSISDSGEVAFSGSTGVGGSAGVFGGARPGQYREVAMYGDPAPGTGGQTLENIGRFDLNANGDVAFSSSLLPGSPPNGIFRASAAGVLTKIVVPGDPSPETVDGVIDGFGSCDGLGIDEAGRVVFTAVDYLGWNAQFALYAGSGSGLTTVAFNSIDPITHNPNTVNYNVGSRSVSNSGQVGYTGPSIQLGSVGGGGSTIAAGGQVAPGTSGGTFSGFGQACTGSYPAAFAPAANDSGDVAFFAEVSGGTSPVGIFLATAGTIAPVALSGQAAPGLGGGAFTWESPPYQYGRPSINNAGDVVFLAHVTAGSTPGIFVHSDGSLATVALSGQVPTGLSRASQPEVNSAGEVAFAGYNSAAIYLALPATGDRDGDGVANSADNCIFDANAGQTNTDGDAMGNACDADDDGDTVADASDNCSLIANSGQLNSDGDPSGDVCDNCPTTTNADQANADGDSPGDACDPCANDMANDADNDGVCVGMGFMPPKVAGNDNCPTVPNTGQQNADGDAWGDACDGCPAVATVWTVPAGDDDCDAFPSSSYDPDTNRAAESFMGTDPLDACADTTDLNDETPDPWPMDNNDDRTANLSDILAYIPVFMTAAPRFDLNADGVAALGDILMYIPFFGITCTP